MTGTELIAAERARQITEEGWTPEHDAQHQDSELAWGACYYAMPCMTMEGCSCGRAVTFDPNTMFQMTNWHSRWAKRQWMKRLTKNAEGRLEAHAGDGWADLYNEYLAGVDSGEIEAHRLSNRWREWTEFARIVGRHVEEYTVPQYGDAPDDPLSSYSEADIVLQIKRYVNRLGTGARGPAEARRDLLKLAHYAGVL